jgi:hypothetical protein
MLDLANIAGTVDRPVATPLEDLPACTRASSRPNGWPARWNDFVVRLR